MSRRAIVVCSRNRPDVLARLLDWLFETAPADSRVIVVEGSDPDLLLSADLVQRWSAAGLVHRVTRPQLTHQRNLALEMLQGEDFVHFIDDDAWPSPAYFAQIEAVLLEHPDAAGAGGLPIYREQRPSPSRRAFKTIFLLDSRHSGRLLRSGANVPYRDLDGVHRVDWLAGCSMSFRVSRIHGLRFDEARRGVGWGEDVDFSLRASERGALFVSAQAHIEHRMSPLGRDTYERMIEEYDINRILLGLDFPDRVHDAAITWSLIGRALAQVASDLSAEAEIYGRRSAVQSTPRVIARSLKRSHAQTRRLHQRAAAMVRDRGASGVTEPAGRPDEQAPVAVRLTGGVGNQLFGFACAYAQARRLHTWLQLETDAVVGDPTRPLGLLPLVDDRQVRLGDRASDLDFVELGFTYDRRVEEIRPGTRLIGWFQSWRYFDRYRDEIRDRIRASEQHADVRNRAPVEPHIALQVRRGDYLRPRVRQYHGICSDRYYLDGVREIRAQLGSLPAIVYTDDLDFGRHLVDGIEGAALDVPDPQEPALSVLLRMSRASAYVISNSSFGWWGAWLAEHPQTVIAPDPWFTNPRMDTRDLLPPGWLLRDRGTG